MGAHTRANLALVGVTALGLLVAGIPWAPAAEAQSASRLDLYVHGFTNPCRLSHPMNGTPPYGEVAQTGTCQTHPAGQRLTYTFDAPPLDAPLQLNPQVAGLFLFWIRPYQPQSGVPIAPGSTSVQFSLEIVGGVQLASGGASHVVGADPDPYRFSVGFSVDERTVPAGAVLRWTATIFAPAGGYNPAAAPYGVSMLNPFQVSVPIRGPESLRESRLRLEASGPVSAALDVGRATNVSFFVHNDGDAASDVRVVFVGLNESMFRAEWKPADGTPGHPAVRLDPGLYTAEQFRLTPLRDGAGVFYVRAEGSFGEFSELKYEFDVTGAAAPTSPAEDGLIGQRPSCGIGGGSIVGETIEAPRTGRHICVWRNDAATVSLRMDVVRLDGSMRVIVRGPTGATLLNESFSANAARSWERATTPIGDWEVEVRLDGFRGAYTFGVVEPSAAASRGTVDPDPLASGGATSQAFLILTGAGAVALPVLAFVAWRLRRL